MLTQAARAEVKIISLASAPMRSATCLRANSTASSLCQPYKCVLLCGLPNCSTKKGSMASKTRGSTGVVDWGRLRGRRTRQRHTAHLHIQEKRLAAQHAALHLHDTRVVVVSGSGRSLSCEAADALLASRSCSSQTAGQPLCAASHACLEVLSNVSTQLRYDRALQHGIFHCVKAQPPPATWARPVL